MAGGELRAEGVYALYPAGRDGDDIVLFDDEARSRERCRFPMLRQQDPSKSDQGFASLADFVAPTGDFVGAFAVTAGLGLDAIVRRFEAAHDDYRAIVGKALADRLAEAFAE